MKAKSVLGIIAAAALLAAFTTRACLNRNPAEIQHEFRFWLPAKAEMTNITKPVAPESNKHIFVPFDQYKSLFSEENHQFDAVREGVRYETTMGKFHYTTIWQGKHPQPKALSLYEYDDTQIRPDGTGVILWKLSGSLIGGFSMMAGILGAAGGMFLAFAIDSYLSRKKRRGDPTPKPAPQASSPAG